MTDLTAVLDRIEALARAASPDGPWDEKGIGTVVVSGSYRGATYVNYQAAEEATDLILTLDPDRVLALIAWTRDMLKRHDWVTHPTYLPYCLGCSGWPCRFVPDAARAWGVTP